MSIITIGPGSGITTDTTQSAGITILEGINAANGNGYITSIKVFFGTAVTDNSFVVGTFYGSGGNYTYRAGKTLGNVAAGSVQTFSGLWIPVSVGDLLGYYFATGAINRQSSAGLFYYVNGQNYVSAGTHSYSSVGQSCAIGGTGVTGSGLFTFHG